MTGFGKETQCNYVPGTKCSASAKSLTRLRKADMCVEIITGIQCVIGVMVWLMSGGKSLQACD